LSCSGWHGIAGAARLKDIAEINGVRMNQLVGYGLVVGLDGSGDGKKATFTIQSLASMLEKMGVTVDQNDIQVKNVAAVMVTAKLPPFAKRGNRIDVLVSSIGDANNLQGGTLMLTPLKGVDGKIYALAQGPVNTGGFGAGGTASTVVKNFPTVGRVLSGAIIEREVPNDFSARDRLQFSLHNPDFNTAARVVDVINAQFAANRLPAPRMPAPSRSGSRNDTRETPFPCWRH
jgi:flagellar P-ring protein precursor FlgI